MKTQTIRPIAVCLIFHRDDPTLIFVAEGLDPAKGQTFYRPLGGGIEFGERGIDTVARELREELAAELNNLRYLGTLENIFVYNGEAGHELVQVYTADFARPDIYNIQRIEAREDDGQPFVALWKSIATFTPTTPLYPDGLIDLIDEKLAG